MSGAELKVVGKLVIAHARQRPGRILLTSLSTIAAACVVVWVVSGYDSLVGRFGDMAEEYLGRYDLLILPAQAEPGGGFGVPSQARLSQDLIDAIRQDPTVALVDPLFETRAAIRRVGAPPPPGRGEEFVPPNLPARPTSGPIIMGGMAQLRTQSRSPALVGTNSTEPLQPIIEGRWFDARQADRREAAITRDSATDLGIKVGDEIVVGATDRPQGTSRVKITAIVEQPKRLPPPKFMVGLPPSREAALQGGPASHAVYVPRTLAARLAGVPARNSYAGVVLKSGGKADHFVASWSERFAKASPPAQVRTPEKVDSEVAESTTFETVRAQAYSATGISLLAALFIIFTTLSMGVDERIRQFAMLRAISLTKTQIGVMIALESLLLGLVGWAGGLLAGWGLLKLMARLRPESVSEGAALGGWCIALSGLCALGGSAAASVLPAWRAIRVSPLEAMAPQNRRSLGRTSLWMTSLGLVLIAINPLLVFYVPMKDAARYGMSAAIGCTSMAIGFALLTPAIVVLTERWLAPLLARLLALNPRFLAMQLSSNMWRTTGATIALTVGLGLFVAMQTWGYSMLGPFTPGTWTPDLIVSIAPAGLADSEVEALRHVKGIVTNEFAPLAVKQVKFADDLTGFQERASATRQDTCVMVGVDPEAALGGDKPLFPFTFVAGTQTEAIAKLKRGRYCLVPDHFLRESNLRVGDKFRVIPPDHPDQALEYEIAGAVSMPGWHWMTKVGFRRGRAAGLMFSRYDQVQRDFDTGRPSLFWMNMDGTATEDQIKAAIQPILARNSVAKAESSPRRNPSDAPNDESRTRAGRRTSGPSVTLRSAAGVREQIRGRADGIIWALSELPLVTLLVTSLGVVNTVLSSVRARRWDMGVLRALGFTRWGLARLIMAEALLVGIVACVLSLGFGAMAGYCGTGVSRYISIRGGQITPLVIPWAGLSIGFAATLGLCLLAALWPAIQTGRTEPLRLLQAGRNPT